MIILYTVCIYKVNLSKALYKCYKTVWHTQTHTQPHTYITQEISDTHTRDFANELLPNVNEYVGRWTSHTASYGFDCGVQVTGRIMFLKLYCNYQHCSCLLTLFNQYCTGTFR